jgi:hypothetical protein
VLESIVPAHFGLSEPVELSSALHTREISTVRLGELAPIVVAVGAEDSVAAGIVLRLADEVIAFARAAIRRLDLTGADPDVVLGGRLLRSVAPTVVETITSEVQEVAPAARVLVSPSEPIVGAALLGLDALAVDASASSRARAELDSAVAEVRTERADMDSQSDPVVASPRDTRPPARSLRRARDRPRG